MLRKRRESPRVVGAACLVGLGAPVLEPEVMPSMGETMGGGTLCAFTGEL